MKLNNKVVKPVRVPPTRFDCILDLVALLLIVLLWLLSIYFFIDGPEKVPTGFDVEGNPRGWGSTAFYFLMSGMGTFYAVAMFSAARIEPTCVSFKAQPPGRWTPKAPAASPTQYNPRIEVSQ